jgi:hypothetical protein
MTKNDKIKLSVAGGLAGIAVLVLLWNLLFSGSSAQKLEPVPEDQPKPNTRISPEHNGS